MRGKGRRRLWEHGLLLRAIFKKLGCGFEDIGRSILLDAKATQQVMRRLLRRGGGGLRRIIVRGVVVVLVDGMLVGLQESVWIGIRLRLVSVRPGGVRVEGKVKVLHVVGHGWILQQGRCIVIRAIEEAIEVCLKRVVEDWLATRVREVCLGGEDGVYGASMH